jgi:predicted Zn-dependent peptidase
LQQTDLPGGIRVVTERMVAQRAAAVGVWVATGSRDEPDALAGGAHFIEHLVFKGTPSRSALQIAETFDAIGGDLNAYTTKESTCFHARTLGEDVPMTIDTIADMLRNATLTDEDIEAERSVVLEEIAMHEDSPEDLVFDLQQERMYAPHPLARRVQGDAETVQAIARDDLRAFHASRYAVAPAVIAAAGDVEHERIVDLVERAFDGAGAQRPAAVPIPVLGDSHFVERDIEQVHLVLSTEGLSRSDDRRWALAIANVALGGGMSSRLFQSIREQRGLAYAVSSGYQGFTDTGVLNVYAGCSPDNAAEVLALARTEIAGLAAEGLTEEEFRRAIGHLRGSILLSLDEPSSLISNFGKSLLYLDRVLTPAEIIARIEAVTLDEVRSVTASLLAGPWSLTGVGPHGSAKTMEAA